jgi:uracil phosphoribosyltransferase
VEDIAPFKVNIKLYQRIPTINGKIVMVADPMLAIGNTMNSILSMIKNHGNPKKTCSF